MPIAAVRPEAAVMLLTSAAPKRNFPEIKALGPTPLITLLEHEAEKTSTSLPRGLHTHGSTCGHRNHHRARGTFIFSHRDSEQKEVRARGGEPHEGFGYGGVCLQRFE